MYFNYDKLLERVNEIFLERRFFAVKMQMSESALNSRIQNKTLFRKGEIDRAVALLDIMPDEIPDYFFKIVNDERSKIEQMQL